MKKQYGETLQTVLYEPIGDSYDRKFQQDFTKTLANLLSQAKKPTLSELGYLHMNSILYSNGQIEVKAYFNLELATEEVDHFHETGKELDGRKLSPAFQAFQNYLFVGNPENSVSIATMNMLPKQKIKEREDGTRYLVLKNKADPDPQSCLVLHCNPDLVLATIQNIDLRDPDFHIDYHTVGDTQDEIVIRGSRMNEYPVEVRIQWNQEIKGYHPEDAIPYLRNKIQKIQKQQQRAEEARENLADRAEVQEEKREKERHKKMRKFS